MKVRLSLVILIILVVGSCTPKVVQVIPEPVVEVKPKYDGPCATFDHLTPAEKDEAI